MFNHANPGDHCLLECGAVYPTQVEEPTASIYTTEKSKSEDRHKVLLRNIAKYLQR